jgi:hypothetical protein
MENNNSNEVNAQIATLQLQYELQHNSQLPRVTAQEIKDTFVFFSSNEFRKDPQVQCKNCRAYFVYTSLQKLRTHIAGRSMNGTRFEVFS